LDIKVRSESPTFVIISPCRIGKLILKTEEKFGPGITSTFDLYHPRSKLYHSIAATHLPQLPNTMDPATPPRKAISISEPSTPSPSIDPNSTIDPNPSTPTNLSSPRQPRWLSLTPYKSASVAWDWETELEAEVEEALIFSSSSSSEAEEEAWEDESEELDPHEKASSRILAVLRCYLFNAENGMLVTGSKVDERVEAALLRLGGREVVVGVGGGACREEQGGETALKESWEISDEERVVLEIEEYGKAIPGLKEDMPKDVEEVVKEILQWARANGTVNGSESQGDMPASRGSLEIAGC
jgi:hypothetical protein